MMFDLVIKNGLIVDGSGRPAYRANVGIKGDRIAQIGELDASGERILDAEGCVVAPGFIDMHSHTDGLVIKVPTCESKLTQGVTTEVSGNCGYSSAPFGGRQNDIEEETKWLMDHGIPERWTTMGEFLDTLDSVQMSINFATFVGHGTIREFVIGYDDREPTPDELAEMARIAEESVRDGAFGVSSGLIYPPACFAKTNELIELCRPTAQYSGVYATHMRNEAENLLAAVDEAITIGREAGVGVQISHHKSCGKKNWGLVNESLAMIDAARADGLDVCADQYPYVATATNLGTMVPEWAHDGGRDALLARLCDPEQRGKIRAQMLQEMTSGYLADSGGWNTVVVSSVKNRKNYFCEGLNIEQIADKLSKHPIDACLDLLSEEAGGVGMMHFVIGEDDVKTVMRHPAVVIGSDATARCSDPSDHGKPHPRAYGTFPRVLGKYVREEKVISLEEGVAKMTGRTAKKLGLSKRGIICEGCFADITIFNPDTVADTATFTDSRRHAEGINFVIVNGRIALENGHITELGAGGSGRVLRRGRE
jgi:N-acyl-D-amino-acid deacylase